MFIVRISDGLQMLLSGVTWTLLNDEYEHSSTVRSPVGVFIAKHNATSICLLTVVLRCLQFVCVGELTISDNVDSFAYVCFLFTKSFRK